MDVFVVQGGTPLRGSVSVSGSKNAALPMMATALLAHGITVLRRVPDLVDVRTMSSLLKTLGCEVVRLDDDSLSLEVINEACSEADYDLVRRMRASVCVTGPLLARRGFARVSLPGGCNIGHRPIDIHLRGFSELGAEVNFENGDIVVQASELKGTEIDLSGPRGSTVTGTCNVMSAATLATGRTILTGAAFEPEVVALADFLNAMGANISGHGTSIIEIEGVEELNAVEQTVIPDRIEAATLLIAAATTRGAITIDGVEANHLGSVIDILREVGVTVSETGLSQLQISSGETFSPVHLAALPYPGIPTDVQAQLSAFLATVSGQSVVRDEVFPDRFMHCAELNRMSASIRQQRDRAFITGVPQLQGANVMASDLRASAALVLAAMAAKGETVIHRIYHLDRGYSALETKLNSLGANIIRCREEDLSQLQSSHARQLRRSA